MYLFLKFEIVELWGIFSPKKYAMIYENPIIFEELLRSDSKEKFYYKKY